VADEPSTGGRSGIVPAAVIAPQATALAALDQRIALAQDPRELLFLTQIRSEIIRQDEDVSDRRHRRYQQRVRLWGSYAFSMLSIGLGTGLFALQQDTAGFFLIGAGIFVFVPRYVMAILNRGEGGRHDEP
jgi:hypothetical protein